MNPKIVWDKRKKKKKRGIEGRIGKNRRKEEDETRVNGGRKMEKERNVIDKKTDRENKSFQENVVLHITA